MREITDGMAYVSGEDLAGLANTQSGLKRRDCVEILADYIRSENREACLISGLQSTGKTTAMLQAILDSGHDFNKMAYMDVREARDSEKVYKVLERLQRSGITHVFIDEVSAIPDFVKFSNLYYGMLANSGMKIILTGTDSLRFDHVFNETLQNKSFLISTTYIPFDEYSRLMPVSSLDQYISCGGILASKYSGFYDIIRDNQGSQLSALSILPGKKYLNSAIAKNIGDTLFHDRDRLFSSLEKVAILDESWMNPG